MNSDNLKNKEEGELNQIKAKDKFEYLKSDYFLEKLFNNLERKKLLKILKYNKRIKNRININIKDYKEYSEIYSPIEIEIKPVNNAHGSFINIVKENEKYFNIYFNNDKEEIKRNYINKDEKVKIIKIIINHQIRSLNHLFSFCECIEYLYFKTFVRNNIEDMNSMFSGCISLKELNLNNFNTDNVNDMSLMFNRCLQLKELNLNNFKTDKVKYMQLMFSECSSLEELNLDFNTKNIVDMSLMFYKCFSLKKLSFKNFNINYETNMQGKVFFLIVHH